MKDDKVYLNHILESIKFIEQYIQDITFEDFTLSNQTQDAVIRRIEIIGEATKKISNSTRDAYPNIPWKLIAGMRDMLIQKKHKGTVLLCQ
ncbi:hypothetical protein SPSYN_00112 [Sporotomaculum syntrophicum]|uniref:DUF86 domain-containing protein n=1 Tax=Sporotomaculum syntrophicum TaxID=182264 RepID=A0A9D2WS20_9FIRM|nr:DUF86 domain-containing protein [Sporotomaculum syntrophicum]KAF1086394.1 hypothetical protein SPSYN_00112 [Sporotomaculum syntrophicum]